MRTKRKRACRKPPARKPPAKKAASVAQNETADAENQTEEAFLNFIHQNNKEKSVSADSNDLGVADKKDCVSGGAKSSPPSSPSSSDSDESFNAGENSSDDSSSVDRRSRKLTKGHGNGKQQASKLPKKGRNEDVTSSRILRSSSQKQNEFKMPQIPQQDSHYNKKELKAALEVITKIMKMDEARPFNVPADPVALGKPDYYSVIDTPMDFGTIRSNLENGIKYMNSGDVFNDAQYIWENCLKCCKKGEYIVYLMKLVKKKFMKYWTAAGLSTEQSRKTNVGTLYGPSTTDYATKHGRSEAFYPGGYAVDGVNQIQQDRLGSYQPYQYVPPLSYNQPYPFQQPPPSTAWPQLSQLPQVSYYQPSQSQQPQPSINQPQFSQLQARTGCNSAGYLHFQPPKDIAPKHKKHGSSSKHKNNASMGPANSVYGGAPSHSHSQHPQLIHQQPYGLQQQQQQQQQNISQLHSSRLPAVADGGNSYFQPPTDIAQAHKNDASTSKHKRHASVGPASSIYGGPASHSQSQHPQLSHKQPFSLQQHQQSISPLQPSQLQNVADGGRFNLQSQADLTRGSGYVPLGPVDPMVVAPGQSHQQQFPLSDGESSEPHQLQPQTSHYAPQSSQIQNRVDIEQSNVSLTDSALRGINCALRYSAGPTTNKTHQEIPSQLGPTEVQSKQIPQSQDERHQSPDRLKRKKRGRGPTRCLFLNDLADGERIFVHINEYGQPVGPEASKLSSFLGTVARNGHRAPLNFVHWRAMPDSYKEDMWEYVQTKFDMDPSGKAWVLQSIATKWRDWKADLKATYYDTLKTDEERLMVKDPRVVPEQWPSLIEYWNSDETKKRCATNRANRLKSKAVHTSGTKSYARIREEERKNRPDGKEPTRAELYVLTHTRKNGQPVDEKAAEFISKIQERAAKKQDDTQCSDDSKDTLFHVIGKEKRNRILTYGLGTTRSDVFGPRPSRKDLMFMAYEAKKSANEEVQKMVVKMEAMEEKYARLETHIARMTSNMEKFLEKIGGSSQILGLEQIKVFEEIEAEMNSKEEAFMDFVYQNANVNYGVDDSDSDSDFDSDDDDESASNNTSSSSSGSDEDFSLQPSIDWTLKRGKQKISHSLNEARSSKVKSRYSKKELELALMVIKKVMKMDEAQPFNVPFDPIAFGLPSNKGVPSSLVSPIIDSASHAEPQQIHLRGGQPNCVQQTEHTSQMQPPQAQAVEDTGQSRLSPAQSVRGGEAAGSYALGPVTNSPSQECEIHSDPDHRQPKHPSAGQNQPSASQNEPYETQRPRQKHNEKKKTRVPRYHNLLDSLNGEPSKFDIELRSKSWVLKTISRCWRNWKAKLKAQHYYPHNTQEEQLNDCHPKVLPDQWQSLVLYWNSDKAKLNCAKNRASRAQQMAKHTTGTKSFARLREEERAKRPDGKEPSRAEIYILSHTRKDGRPVDDAAAAIISKLREQATKRQTVSGDDNDSHDTLYQVLGSEKPGQVRTYGLGPTPSDIWGEKCVCQKMKISTIEEEKSIFERMNSMEQKYAHLEAKIDRLTSNMQKFLASVGASSKILGFDQTLDASDGDENPLQPHVDGSSPNHAVPSDEGFITFGWCNHLLDSYSNIFFSNRYFEDIEAEMNSKEAAFLDFVNQNAYVNYGVEESESDDDDESASDNASSSSSGNDEDYSSESSIDRALRRGKRKISHSLNKGRSSNIIRSRYNEKELQLAAMVIKKVMKVDEAQPFNVPFDPIAFGLPPKPTQRTIWSQLSQLQQSIYSHHHQLEQPLPQPSYNTPHFSQLQTDTGSTPGSAMIDSASQPEPQQIHLRERQPNCVQQPEHSTSQLQPPQVQAAGDIGQSHLSPAASMRGGRAPCTDAIDPASNSLIQEREAHSDPNLQQPNLPLAGQNQPSQSQNEPNETQRSRRKRNVKRKTRVRSQDNNLLVSLDGEPIFIPTNELGQPVGPKATMLSNFIGKVAKDGHLAPLSYITWRKMPNEAREEMWRLVRSKFDIETQSKKWVLKTIGKRWSDWKAKLKADHYNPHNTDEERLNDCHPNVLPDQWQALVSYWNTDKAKILCAVNKACRAKQKALHTAGRKSFARIREEEKEKRPGGKEPSRAELYILTHTRKDGQPVDDAAAEIIAKLREKASQKPTVSGDSNNSQDTLFQVMGSEKTGRVRTYGMGPTPTELWGQKCVCQKTRIPTTEEENSILEKMKVMEKKYARMEARMNRMTSKILKYLVNIGAPSNILQESLNTSDADEDPLQPNVDGSSSNCAVPSDEIKVFEDIEAEMNSKEAAFLDFVNQNAYVNYGVEESDSDESASDNTSSSSSGNDEDYSSESSIDWTLRRGKRKISHSLNKGRSSKIIRSRYNEKELQLAAMVIKRVMKMDEAQPFNVPFDPIAFGLPNYVYVIDSPMDFGIVWRNLRNGVKYMNSEDVYMDVKQIWENCYKFSKKGDYTFHLIKLVKKMFLKYWTEAGLYSKPSQEISSILLPFLFRSPYHVVFQSHSRDFSMRRSQCELAHFPPSYHPDQLQKPPQRTLWSQLSQLQQSIYSHHHQLEQPQPQPSYNTPQFSQLQTGTYGSTPAVKSNKVLPSCLGSAMIDSASQPVPQQIHLREGQPNCVQQPEHSTSQLQPPQVQAAGDTGQSHLSPAASMRGGRAAGTDAIDPASNSLIQEREAHTDPNLQQPNLPSAGQKQPSGSQNKPYQTQRSPRKRDVKRKTRLPTQDHNLLDSLDGEPIFIPTNELGQPVGPKATMLSKFLGKIAKDGHLAPLSYITWRKMPKEAREKMWRLVRSKFDIETKSKSWVLKTIGKRWKDWKAKLKADHYNPHNTDEERLNDCHPSVLPDQWQALVSYWNSDKAKLLCAINNACRAKQRALHTAGSKSFARIREEEKARRPGGKEPSRAELYILTHTRKDGQPVDDAAAEIIAKLREKASQRETVSGESNNSQDTLFQVMGSEKTGRVRTYGMGPTPTELWGQKCACQKRRLPATEEENSILEKMKGMEQKYARMEARMNRMTSKILKYLANIGGSSNILQSGDTSDADEDPLQPIVDGSSSNCAVPSDEASGREE
ncbi:hypothetical protein CCACVL1_16302 [Corchorus capsularis]|uniref:Bromo domain-containing protein n=1 Tax=Corchorus capsularis TaxID=210143 RepID=A0A1R3HY01_COCAP|nr:hypothetical protein CCACVL1_16302 [Corchorus capsularis]